MKNNKGLLILAILLLIQSFYMAEFPVVSEPIGNSRVYAFSNPALEADVKNFFEEEDRKERKAKLTQYANNTGAALMILAVGIYFVNKNRVKDSCYDEEATMASVFSKKGLFSWRGRRNRLPYFLVNCVGNLIACILMAIYVEPLVYKRWDLKLLLTFLLLCFSYIMFVNISKRLQDMNISRFYGIVFIGFSILSGMVPTSIFPIINLAIFATCSLRKGTTGDNLYGPDRLASPNSTSKVFANGETEYEVDSKVNDKAESASVVANSSSLQADAILKYKKLLDMGAITPEEYEEKKKQILNM